MFFSPMDLDIIVWYWTFEMAFSTFEMWEAKPRERSSVLRMAEGKSWQDPFLGDIVELNSQVTLKFPFCSLFVNDVIN